MIIKSLSRSNTSGIGSLIRYIFREQKLTVKRYNYFVNYLISKQNEHKPVYVAGIKLNNNDVKYLLSEVQDTKLLAELKTFKSVKDFIQQRLITQRPEIVKESKPFLVTHNLRDNKSLESIIKQFEVNETNRIYKRSNQTTVHHTILAWNNKNAGEISDTILRKMAYEYIRLRGENNIYCITKHIDKENTTHLHVAMGATNLRGLSARISKQEFGELKIAMDSFQKQHFKSLNQSLPEHGKKQRDKEAEKNYKRNERSSILKKLSCLGEIQEKSISTSHFIDQLKARDIEVYQRGGKHTGIVCNGYKFRFAKLGIDLDKLSLLDVRLVQEKKQLDEILNLRIRGKDMGIMKATDIEATKNSQEQDLKNSEEKELQALAEIRESNNDRDIELDNAQDATSDISDDTEDDNSDDIDDTDSGSDDSDNEAETDDEDTEIDDGDDSDDAKY